MLYDLDYISELPNGAVRYGDIDSGELLTVTQIGDCDDGPLFTIDGALTLPQLHELTHRLTMLLVPDVSAQTCAAWARKETLRPLADDEDMP